MSTCKPIGSTFASTCSFQSGHLRLGYAKPMNVVLLVKALLWHAVIAAFVCTGVPRQRLLEKHVERINPEWPCPSGGPHRAIDHRASPSPYKPWPGTIMQDIPHGCATYCERFKFAQHHKLTSSPNHGPASKAIFIRAPLSALHHIRYEPVADHIWALRALLFEAVAAGMHVWLILGAESASPQHLRGEMDALTVPEFAPITIVVSKYQLSAQFPSYRDSWFQADHQKVLAWMQLTNRTTVPKARALPLGLALGGVRPETDEEFAAQVQRLHRGEQLTADPVFDYEAVFSVEHDVRYTGRSWGVFLQAAWNHARLHPHAAIAHGNGSIQQASTQRTGHGVAPDLMLFQHPCVVNEVRSVGVQSADSRAFHVVIWTWGKEPTNFTRASTGQRTHIPHSHLLHVLMPVMGLSRTMLGMLADYMLGGSYAYMEVLGPSLAYHHGLKISHVQPGALYNITNIIPDYQIGWVRPGACMDWPWQTNDTHLGGGLYECCGDEIIAPVYVSWALSGWCQGYALIHPIKAHLLPWPPPAQPPCAPPLREGHRTAT